MSHIHPTQSSGEAFVRRQIDGPVVMLNLLRFREVADYSASPDLAPESSISGRHAYARYAAATEPLLQQAGGEVVFAGAGGLNMIGPEGERWDLVMLVRYPDPQAFLSFAGDGDYLAIVGHRTAALEDSRLLPIEPADVGGLKAALQVS